MEFDVKDILQSAVGYKGLPFPGAWYGGNLSSDSSYTGKDFDQVGAKPNEKMFTTKGIALRKKDMLGRYYFMPVVFVHEGTEYEIDCALVSISRKKDIVKTPLIGRRGNVKELISIDDYQIDIKGAVVGEDGEWPEEKLDKINELFNINEAIELRCALTGIFMQPNDKVVIFSDNLPPMKGVEHVQVIDIKCETDRAFELIIE